MSAKDISNGPFKRVIVILHGLEVAVPDPPQQPIRK